MVGNDPDYELLERLWRYLRLPHVFLDGLAIFLLKAPLDLPVAFCNDLILRLVEGTSVV